jgi:hypothetical protein
MEKDVCIFCKEPIGKDWDMVWIGLSPKKVHPECNRISLLPLERHPTPRVADGATISSESDELDGTPRR